MLRSLINDANDPRNGQPKPREEFSEDEKFYVDVIAQESDRAMRLRMARAAAESEALLKGAEAMIDRGEEE